MKQYEAVINFMSYCEQTLRAEPPWLKKLGTRRERLEKKSSFGCILRQNPLSFTINKVNHLVPGHEQYQQYSAVVGDFAAAWNREV